MKIYGHKTKDKELFKYMCEYCGDKFKVWVGSTGDGKSKITTQIKCKSCGNFLKTA